MSASEILKVQNRQFDGAAFRASGFKFSMIDPCIAVQVPTSLRDVKMESVQAATGCLHAYHFWFFGELRG